MPKQVKIRNLSANQNLCAAQRFVTSEAGGAFRLVEVEAVEVATNSLSLTESCRCIGRRCLIEEG